MIKSIISLILMFTISNSYGYTMCDRMHDDLLCYEFTETAEHHEYCRTREMKEVEPVIMTRKERLPILEALRQEEHKATICYTEAQFNYAKMKQCTLTLLRSFIEITGC